MANKRDRLAQIMQEAFEESIQVSKESQFEERYGVEFYGAVQTSPAPTINPERPRALRLAYIKETETLLIQFRDKTICEYEGIPYEMWNNLKSTDSTGRYIDSSGIYEYPYKKVSIDKFPQEVQVRFER
jgi:KTSC domain